MQAARKLPKLPVATPARSNYAFALEPIVVTFGATMISDTLSLLVFAVCVRRSVWT